MTDQNHAGTSQVMLEEFIKGDVPELKRIYDSVMAGNPLNAGQLEVMRRFLDESHAMARVIHEFPEYQELIGSSIEIYHEITAKALENERNN